MVVIPGGCTSVLQPADVSWNGPFKKKLQDQFDEWMYSGPVDLTPARNRRAALIATLHGWVKEAWKAVTPEVIQKSFKKCGITNDLDGSEDYLFNVHSDNEEGTDFEGFTPAQIDAGQEFTDNITSTLNLNLSDGSESDSDHQEDDTDYDSPGH